MNIYDLVFTHINTENPNLAIYDSQLISYSYSDLAKKIAHIETTFNNIGLSKGNIVVLQTEKSFNALAHLLCCIKMGIIYVPIAVDSPSERTKKIIAACQANAVLNADYSLEKINDAKTNLSSDAYSILFTSGSTGTPKGVVCSTKGLMAFINWSSSEFNVTEKDLIAGYAPFHFDISTFDIFASISKGASLWLIDKTLGANIRLIGQHLKTIQPTVWYTTPTVFNLLNEYGKLPENYCPKTVLFAGEVFPIKQLNALRQQWQIANYYNLYGPTETNVCTYFKLPQQIEQKRTIPYPIGKSCPYVTLKINAANELLVSGETVLINYINNADCFVEENGIKWYNTGDLVSKENDNLLYQGRTDRMVKRRGYRIELGEIENTLAHHENIQQVAVICVTKNELPYLILFYSGTKTTPTTLFTYCSKALLNYMIPDKFMYLESFPINENGKIDYTQLIDNFNQHE